MSTKGSGAARVYTASEVAEILKVNIATVRLYLRGGQLVGFRLKKRWRIRASELEKFMSGQSQTLKGEEVS